MSKDLLSSREVENIFENSDFVYMLNQAGGDRQILAKQLGISTHQLSYVTHSGEGEGLLFYGSTILPFVDHFPKNTELYRIMTTKPQELKKEDDDDEPQHYEMRIPLMFFDRAVNAQRSQLLTVMADAVSECRTAADQAAELNETGQVGLLRLAEVWSAIRAKEGMGGLVLEGTEAKILSDVVAQFYAYLSGCMFNDPVGMAIYAELHYMMSSLMLGEWFE